MWIRISLCCIFWKYFFADWSEFYSKWSESFSYKIFLFEQFITTSYPTSAHFLKLLFFWIIQLLFIVLNCHDCFKRNNYMCIWRKPLLRIKEGSSILINTLVDWALCNYEHNTYCALYTNSVEVGENVQRLVFININDYNLPLRLLEWKYRTYGWHLV